ncbi:hypothetical protein [Nitrososphaera sp.]|uniref:hypothetical protein n=1 Tax=Nitrososphaera sp. TaxID=1971748 RepID=UPI00182E03C0|nr:hypothetical protein [Nitrososphaera sp.]NWG38111.1 hypothetical protein [Nitrososphaera sp.]
MPNGARNSSRISGLRLKEAFESLSKILGQSIVDLLVYDLERQGIALGAKDEYYTLDQIRQVFEGTFGEDGTSLLMKKLREELEG